MANRFEQVDEVVGDAVMIFFFGPQTLADGRLPQERA